MNKTFMTAGVSLALLASPALSGPALDAIIGQLPGDVEISYSSSQESGDTETYENFRMLSDSDVIMADMISFALDGSIAQVSGVNVRMGTPSDTRVVMESLDLSFSMDIVNIDEVMRMADPTSADDLSVSAEECATLDIPVALQIQGLSADARMFAEQVNVSARSTLVDDSCIVDVSNRIINFSAVGPMNIDVTVDLIEMRINTPVGSKFPESLTGEIYETRVSLQGAALVIEGTPQVMIREITALSKLDGDTLLPLVLSGLNEQGREVFDAIAEDRMPAGDIPYADLWNGFREVVSQTQFRLSGVEIVSDTLEMLSPLPGLLSKGSSLDAHLFADKSAEDIRISMAFEMPHLIILGAEANFRMEELPAAMNSAPVQMVMLNAPLSLVSSSIAIDDRGAFVFAEIMTGVSPEDMFEHGTEEFIPAPEMAAIKDWIARARTPGGTALQVMPSEPVSLMALGLVAASNLAALPDMLNLEVSAP